jgi:hypothetical protein
VGCDDALPVFAQWHVGRRGYGGELGSVFGVAGGT